ncbi:MAG: bifunctional phosphopantothenoylcysteine decarboxylase/phosphopantothenate synthase, partial [Methylocystis sp.]|nr:bifunctional phosphopantothenoylcysteine decarboxylase/phosphopantothenate synthase [Methylocystis sp.]
DPPGVEVRHVETTRDMLEACEAALPADIFVSAAAVADWRVDASASKVKKQPSGAPPTLVLRENPDIVARIGARKEGRPTLVVGFAAETNDLIANARAKLERKRCDLMVANDVSVDSGVLGGEANEVHLVSARGVETWPRQDKSKVAAMLIERLAEQLRRRQGAAGEPPIAEERQ